MRLSTWSSCFLIPLACGALHAADLVPGVIAEYFPQSDGVEDFPIIPASTKPALKRVEPAIAVEETADTWPGTTFSDHFSVRWTGILRVAKSGTYTLFVESDDGSRLFIDGKHIVDNGGLHGMEEQSGAIELTAGDHALKLDYFENDGNAGCKLSWSTGTGEKTVVPASAFFHDASLVPAAAK